MLTLLDLSHTTNLHDNFVIRQAYALGKSLEDGHSNVKVKYLRQESTRYSLDSLHDVDILMILQHSYDLPRMLALLQDNGRDSYQESSSTFCSKKHRVKANILTIAWLLDESLMSWLLQPWIGNYDFLLTSSMIAKLAIQKIIDEVGLTTSCSIACPRLSPLSTRSSVYSTEYLPSKYSFVAKKEERSRTRALEEEEDKTWEFPKSRSQAMVDVLPPVISNALSLGVEEAQSFQNNRNVEDVVRMATRKTKELDFLVVSVQTNNHQKFVSQVFESKAMWTKGKAMEFHFTNSTTSSVTSSGSNSDNYNFDAIISPEELLPVS